MYEDAHELIEIGDVLQKINTDDHQSPQSEISECLKNVENSYDEEVDRDKRKVNYEVFQYLHTVGGGE